MRVISWPRRAGKTTKVLRWWQTDPYSRVVITAFESEAERLRGMVPEELRDIARRNIHSYRVDRGHGYKTTFVVDNVDLLLNRLVGHVDFVTVTDE